MKITSLSNFKMGLTTLAASSIVLFSPVQGIAQTVDKAPASDTFEKKLKSRQKEVLQNQFCFLLQILKL